ncbi:S-adenosyl-L-methionine-dependent methyltransferase [Pluteus cervinus]|uniref:S-adenosyl-L-methionine-dependent methyltransferase n=1 Tax=Pluteus cervinus TaxID=181527 RepID=A0ACD3AX96_9AGAR|nr:S-adenosyl-L-methionine-dependent methyltransferase [Pluteus cervinus]
MTTEENPSRKARKLSGPDAPDASGWSASLYNRTATFVYSQAFTAPVLELLAPKPGERIIDFGCGSGEVTLQINRVVEQKPGGITVGVDLSESLLAKAKANGLRHAYVGDIQALDPSRDIPGHEEKFDAVFSNAALHWCRQNPPGVLQSAKAVLKPGGRLVAEMGGFMNCIGVRAALYQVLRARGHDPIALDPWYFPSMEDYVKLLVTAGFEPVHVSLTPRITPISTGLGDWQQLFVRNSFLKDLSDEEAAEIMDEVENICRVDCQDQSGKWAMMYMRLRFSAVLK